MEFNMCLKIMVFDYLLIVSNLNYEIVIVNVLQLLCYYALSRFYHIFVIMLLWVSHYYIYLQMHCLQCSFIYLYFTMPFWGFFRTLFNIYYTNSMPIDILYHYSLLDYHPINHLITSISNTLHIYIRILQLLFDILTTITNQKTQHKSPKRKYIWSNFYNSKMELRPSFEYQDQ